MACRILIQNGSSVIEPVVEEGIEWTTQRKGTPGKLTFKALAEGLNVQEGNAVRLDVDGNKCFFGYVFTKERDRDGFIKFTCYDQLRYFKNKDTYVYHNKTASELLGMICADFNLNTGSIESTGYSIPSKKESNKTLFDIMQDALDDTMMSTGNVYVLYDDYGSINLKNISSMKLPIVIDEETGQNYSYKSSIDSETYNQIKLVRDNEKTGGRDVYMVRNDEDINNWGTLQYFESLTDSDKGAEAEKAENLLKIYDKKTRNLSISGAFGYIGIRAGSAPIVKMRLGDVDICNYMVCDKVTHKFENDLHTMDLTLIGGDFTSG